MEIVQRSSIFFFQVKNVECGQTFSGWPPSQGLFAPRTESPLSAEALAPSPFRKCPFTRSR